MTKEPSSGGRSGTGTVACGLHQLGPVPWPAPVLGPTEQGPIRFGSTSYQCRFEVYLSYLRSIKCVVLEAITVLGPIGAAQEPVWNCWA